MLDTADVQKKWAGVLDHADLPKITDPHRRAVVAAVLENTVREARSQAEYVGSSRLLSEAAIPANMMGGSSSTASDGAIDIFDPVLISLVRRTMPNLIAYDIMGVQPMTGPTGLIFAMRSRYSNQAGDETFYNEVNTAFSTVVTGANTLGQKHVGTLPGNSTATANLAETGVYNYGSGMSTAQAEALGTDANSAFPEMAFSIEKITVTAKSRALAAGYTLEIAQDLRAVHRLDADNELSNILTGELLAEINREAIRTVITTASIGCTEGTAATGIFNLDVDANGRWSVEKFKGLMFQLEREANQIAKGTRFGKGNVLLCSSDVASALQMAGVLDYTPALNSNNLQVDDTGSTFAGVLNGRIRVYIDPYTTGNYAVMGYKGPSAMQAGLFYCPYVPLTKVQAVDPQSFAPRFGFKTRYGMVANPFAQGLVQGNGALVKDSNVFYRRFLVHNLL